MAITLNLDGVVPDDGTPLALKHALRHAVADGWRVFPCEPRGKRPIVKWRTEATTDTDTIRAWWDTEPHANLGVCTGDGLIVIDLDGPDGANTYDLLVAHLGALPKTLTANTGKGRHLYYRADGYDLRNSAGKLGPGVDIRAEGGYVIAPPSMHPSGARYTWEKAGADVARLPDAWAAKIAEANRNDASSGAEVTPASDVPQGQRNDFLWRSACRLRRMGLAYPALLAALHAENRERCKPPAPARDVEAIAERAQATYGATDPIIASVTPRGDGTFDIEGHDLPSGTDDNEPVDVIDAMLPTETWDEFRDAADEDIAYLVRDVWPAGSFGIIGAAPKVGKTWVAIDLALALTLGEPFLGHDVFDSSGVPVLYVALEGHRVGLKHRIGALSRGRGANPDESNPNLHITYKPRGMNLADERWARALRVKAQRVGAKLVIVDVMRAAARIKENDAAEFAGLFANLAPIADDGCSVAMLHHMVKLSETSKERTAAERLSGTGAMYGAVDAAILLTERTTEGVVSVQFVARDLAEPKPLMFVVEGDEPGSGPNGGYLYRDSIELRLRDAKDSAPSDGTTEFVIAKPETALEQPQAPQLARDIAQRVHTLGRHTTTELAEAFTVSKHTIGRQRPHLPALDIAWATEGQQTVYFPAFTERRSPFD